MNSLKSTLSFVYIFILLISFMSSSLPVFNAGDKKYFLLLYFFPSLIKTSRNIIFLMRNAICSITCTLFIKLHIPCKMYFFANIADAFARVVRNIRRHLCFLPSFYLVKHIFHSLLFCCLDLLYSVYQCRWAWKIFYSTIGYILKRKQVQTSLEVEPS